MSVRLHIALCLRLEVLRLVLELAPLRVFALFELCVAVQNAADHAERHVDRRVRLERLAEQQDANERRRDLVEPADGRVRRCRRRRHAPERREVQANADDTAYKEEEDKVQVAQERIAPDRERFAVQDHWRGEQRQRDEVVVERHAKFRDLERRLGGRVPHVEHVAGRRGAVEEHPDVPNECAMRRFAAANVAVRRHDRAHEHDAETCKHEDTDLFVKQPPLADDDDDVCDVLEHRDDVDWETCCCLCAGVQHRNEEERHGRPLLGRFAVVVVVRNELLHLGDFEHEHGDCSLCEHDEHLLLKAVVLLPDEVPVREHHDVRHHAVHDAREDRQEQRRAHFLLGLVAHGCLLSSVEGKHERGRRRGRRRRRRRRRGR